VKNAGEHALSSWDQGYIDDIFGAIEDVDYDDEVALEHIGELEFNRQMSEQLEMRKHTLWMRYYAN